MQINLLRVNGKRDINTNLYTDVYDRRILIIV